MKTYLYQTQQIRKLEQIASEKFNLTDRILMQRAGWAAFECLQKQWPSAKKIGIVCGGGNNGGDGYVLARYAYEAGLTVSIWQVGESHRHGGVVHDVISACQQLHIPISQFDETVDLTEMDVIVDAICGIGVHEALRSDVEAVVGKINSALLPVLAIDVPTGIDADTGHVWGSAIRATATITFMGLKLGLLTGSGVAYTGALTCHSLQLPASLFSEVNPIAEITHFDTYAPYLKPRSRDWHKGKSGHVLIIGGDLGFAGAPRMAAEAALRVGAGLVTVATHPDHAFMVNAARPEIMCQGIQSPELLSGLVEKANVVVLGPGLGRSPWSRAVWEWASKQTVSLVMDADGLNFLSESGSFNDNWVLTPHPGEAARLLGVTVQAIQQDRLAAISKMNQRYGGVCVLKGAGTLVLSQDTLPVLCDQGNPGMATAGMGDVLSGVIGGLIAQEVPLDVAAKLGVYLHAVAGDLAAREGERGMIAMDLMPHLRQLSNPEFT
jgi:NAD(P)H-hydrate epimerase